MFRIFRTQYLEVRINSGNFQFFNGLYILHYSLIGNYSGDKQKCKLIIPFEFNRMKLLEIDAGARYKVCCLRRHQISIYEQLKIIGILKEYFFGKPEADPVKKNSDCRNQILFQENRT